MQARLARYEVYDALSIAIDEVARIEIFKSSCCLQQIIKMFIMEYVILNGKMAVAPQNYH
jgi:hypothetical protein